TSRSAVGDRPSRTGPSWYRAAADTTTASAPPAITTRRAVSANTGTNTAAASGTPQAAPGSAAAGAGCIAGAVAGVMPRHTATKATPATASAAPIHRFQYASSRSPATSASATAATSSTAAAWRWSGTTYSAKVEAAKTTTPSRAARCTPSRTRIRGSEDSEGSENSGDSEGSVGTAEQAITNTAASTIPTGAHQPAPATATASPPSTPSAIRTADSPYLRRISETPIAWPTRKNTEMRSPTWPYRSLP